MKYFTGAQEKDLAEYFWVNFIILLLGIIYLGVGIKHHSLFGGWKGMVSSLFGGIILYWQMQYLYFRGNFAFVSNSAEVKK